jgi:hypothetical protein
MAARQGQDRPVMFTRSPTANTSASDDHLVIHMVALRQPRLVPTLHVGPDTSSHDQQITGQFSSIINAFTRPFSPKFPLN